MHAANRTRHGRIVRKAAMVRTHPLNRGAVTWWPALPGRDGGGVWYDIAGRNTGTLNGSPTWQATQQPGGFGQLALNGTSQYVSGTPNPSTTAYSYAFWIKGTSAPSTASIVKVLVNGTGSDSYGFAWSHSNASFEQAAYHQNAGSTYFSAQITATLSAGVWYHVAATWDGSALRVYLNGQLQATTTSVTSVVTPSGSLTLGAAAATQYFAGAINDYRSWNVALSGGAVLQLYNLSRVSYPGVLARDDRATWAALYAPGTAPPATTLFRRTLYRRTGSRGVA